MEAIEQTLKALMREIRGCTKCKNPPSIRLEKCKYNLKPWPEDRRVIFIGERPSVRKGQKEIEEGKEDKNYEGPKRADKLFREMREKYKFDKCYITDMVKCIGEAGKLEWEKAYKCPEMFLRREIEVINPKAVVAMGKRAESRLQELLGPDREVIYIPHPSSIFRGKKYEEKFKESFKELDLRLNS